jgi:(4S)-4-hydroxy-5-phosphonooxypentane-2,3-dione isomerase
MYGVIVTINIKPGFKERFMPSMLEDAQGSVNNEPGCLRFDVFQDSEDPNRIYLMEEYVDEAAFETQTRQPHFVKWQETTKDWFAGPIEIKRVSAIYPSER